MKIKMFSGKKTCKSGETYTFKNGFAIVPGFLIGGKEVKISISEFVEMNNKSTKE